MTAVAFTSGNFPSNIDTLEELLVWACLAYNRHNSSQSRIDADGAFPVCPLKIQVAPDGTHYFTARVQVAIDPAYMSDTSVKIWNRAIEVPGSAALLTGFKS